MSVERPYFVCNVCGFKRSHRWLTGGWDGWLALLRVRLHQFLRGHA